MVTERGARIPLSGRLGRRGRPTLAALQWRLADELVACSEALRVSDRPVEAVHALLVLTFRACRELGEVVDAERAKRRAKED